MKRWERMGPEASAAMIRWLCAKHGVAIIPMDDDPTLVKLRGTDAAVRAAAAEISERLEIDLKVEQQPCRPPQPEDEEWMRQVAQRHDVHIDVQGAEVLYAGTNANIEAFLREVRQRYVVQNDWELPLPKTDPKARS